jgi:hypothetical protein
MGDSVNVDGAIAAINARISAAYGSKRDMVSRLPAHRLARGADARRHATDRSEGHDYDGSRRASSARNASRASRLTSCR